jgi:hypothetical protein
MPCLLSLLSLFIFPGLVRQNGSRGQKGLIIHMLSYGFEIVTFSHGAFSPTELNKSSNLQLFQFCYMKTLDSVFVR